MGAAEREVLCDEGAVTDEVVLFDGERSEVVLDGAEYLSEALPSLEPRRVVHQVLRHQVLQHGRVARLLSPVHLLDHFCGGALAHDSNLSVSPGSAGPFTSCVCVLPGPSPVRSARVIPSGCPGGHWTSSMRYPSGSVSQAVQKLSEPSGEVAGSGSSPRPWSRATVS